MYDTVDVLNKTTPAILIRTGAGQKPAPTDNVIDLGNVSRVDMPALLATADLFIQPGKPDPFENYRFPSKTPEMAVIGRYILTADLPYTTDFQQDPILQICDPTPEAFAARVLSIKGGAERFPTPDITRSIIRDRLAPEKLAKQLVDFYSELIP